MQQDFMGLNTRSLLMAGAIAGVGIGLLSNIPLIACLNCLLLAWVWGGGIGAVYLYRQYQNLTPLTIPQGLVIGAVAGVIGALVGGVVGLVFGGLSTAFSAMINSMAGDSSNFIPSFLFTSGVTALSIIGNVFLYGIVGAIGGLLATALIWKAPTPPMAPPPPYSPPPSPGL